MGWHMLDMLSAAFPPKPAFTEKNLDDLKDRVYIVTGANTGVGKELARILYSKNARVYVAARDEVKAEAAISSIKESHPDSTGSLAFLSLDLADLPAVAASAARFLEQEKRLDVLFNNAGVMLPAAGSLTKQGYELQLGVNNVGPFLFTRLLTPLLASTAKTVAPAGSVRVVWVASSAAEMVPIVPTGGIDMNEVDNRASRNNFACYALSKSGNVLHGIEYAKRHAADGIISVPLNPGNLDSELWRTQWSPFAKFLRTFVLYPAVHGAYTELFAGLSPDVTQEKSGEWVAPWGRHLTLRSDLKLAGKSREEGGHGTAEAFWEWSEKQVKEYL